MILKSVKEIELESGLMVYPYKVDFDLDAIDSFFVFAADYTEAVAIAKFIAWRDFDLNVDSAKVYVDRFILYDQYLEEVKGVDRIDKKDSDLAQGQCF